MKNGKKAMKTKREMSKEGKLGAICARLTAKLDKQAKKIVAQSKKNSQHQAKNR